MAYFKVSFQYSENTYCANIAQAETIEDVQRHYNSKYAWTAIDEATPAEVEVAKRKGMPIITVEHIEEEEEEEMEEVRTVDEIREEIEKYFKENEEEYNTVIEDLDSYNGYLGDDRYFYMEELDELYTGTEPTEMLTRAFYGYDADTWTTDGSGNKTYGAFNPNREYFTYNGYGNLVSTDYKNYTDKLDRWFIDAVIENAQYLYLPDEVAALLDELAEIEA